MGLIAGAAVGGLLVIGVAIAVGILCTIKLRTRSKSVNLTSEVVGFENRVYGVANGSARMSTMEKHASCGESPHEFGLVSVTSQKQRDLSNPLYDGVFPPFEKESQFMTNEGADSGTYDSPQDILQQKCVSEGLDVYDYASAPEVNPPTGKKALLECYSAADYYSTLNDCTDHDYDDILEKVERSGGVIEDDDSANHYCCPASKEDELYKQLRRQRIKSIPVSHIKQLSVIGSGEFGTVCKGQWIYSDKVLDVAIKVLSDVSDQTKFLQEAAIMSQFRHPNVIKLYGVVTEGQQIMLVVEMLEKGDLRQALANMTPDLGQLHAPDLPLTLLAFSRQTALGMVYLSGRGFVHRDIAARNILLSHNNICKISDFGMSRDLDEGNYYVSQGGKIPVKWTAPEALAYKKYSTASDVWGYGCLLYEIWSVGHKPFEQHTNREVVQRVEKGYRLSPPPGCPRAIYDLMMDCWNPTPAARPTFRQVLQTLLGEDRSLLEVLEEARASHSLAGVLGSPLEAGHRMYLARQHCYTAGR
jgi:hypothetical protein